MAKIDGRNADWTITFGDFGHAYEVMGGDVLVAFCRCFIHADRLNSTLSCMHASGQYHGTGSVAYSRDLNTMVWFSIGTLHEMAKAIKYLHDSLAKAKLLDAKSDPWIQLNALKERWGKRDFFVRMRNKAAFHVDADLVGAGLAALLPEGDVELSAGVGELYVDSRLVIGYRALDKGLGLEEGAYRDVVNQVKEDHLVAGKAVLRAFILAAERAGVDLVGTELDDKC